MPDSQLKQEFFTALKASKSYGFLTRSEQSRLLQIFENATDEQFVSALEDLNQDAKKQRELEEKQRENEQKAVALAIEMKTMISQIDREAARENEEKDTEESSQEADKLLTDIGSADKNGKSKRKKIFGLF
jgi:hypothetical protein